MRAAAAVPLALFAAWCANDAEELVTMAPSSRRALARVPAAVPLPAAWRAEGLSQRHVEVGVGVMAVVMAGFSFVGWRTGGRSRLFQDAVTVFGLHGIGHVVSPVLTRGYTSGSATGPVCIAMWLWGRRALVREGVWAGFRPASLLLFPFFMAIAHGVAFAVTGRRGRSAAALGEA